MRREQFTLLEIGIFRGASLATWKAYFPQAEIIGIDVDPSCANYAGGRVRVEIGSQYDEEFIRGICERYKPRVIIDDGSHIAEHQIFTFEKLFPYLPPGGIYVVEDIYFHGWASKGVPYDTVPSNPIDYFIHIARYAIGAEGMPEKNERTPAIEYAVHYVDEVLFFRGAVVIKKRGGASPDAIAKIVEASEALALQYDTPERWHWASQLIIAHQGPPDRAAAAVRRAIAGDGNVTAYYRTLSRILRTAGDIPGAIDAMRKAVEIGVASADVLDEATSLELLAELYVQASQIENARASYANALKALCTLDMSTRGIAPFTERISSRLDSLQPDAGR